jgi:phosphotransferase system IIA component
MQRFNMSEKIYIGIDNKKIEAKGEQLEYILNTQAEIQESERLIEAAEKEKAEKKESATNKLIALGLTDSEVEALLG